MGLSWDCHGNPPACPSSLDCGLAEVSVGLASETSMVAITFRARRRSEDPGGAVAGGDVTQKVGDFLTQKSGGTSLMSG